MIYAHTYQPGTTFKAADGWKKNTVLSLNSIKTLGVELTELETAEQAMALIQSSDVQMVSFALFGLPRHPVPVTHKKLGRYLRKIFKTFAPKKEPPTKYGFSIHQDLALALCIEKFGACPFGCVKNGAPNCDANVRGLVEGRQPCEPGRLTAQTATMAEKRAAPRSRV